ncbi:glycoside hydrolase family 13 protein [Agrilactobacillus fermenti]|uniref:glycoside hydrolase family 13 protein n=1 Tax=Agrilactobacillus fermenti TaxID=2586909 RepID=UPI003A5BEFEC
MAVDWHQNQVIYQIYPKSFYDYDQDGVGDLQGIIAKLDYLKTLGVTTLWLNPIFVSPQRDNGYDVSNYFAIDPMFGTMADFEALVAAVHERGMYLILDFVLNHTSDQHPWFLDACRSRDSPFRDYYIWADGQGDREPNNWASFFGGSVWQKEPQTQQYYFHLFNQQMPDLNWRNPEVRQAMLEIAEFWVDKGIDGLRLDAFIHIAKAALDQDYPGLEDQLTVAEFYVANLPEVNQYLEAFVSALKRKQPDLFILGEAASADTTLLAQYTDPTRSRCDAAVTFRTLVDRPIVEDRDLPFRVQRKEIDVLEMQQQFAAISAQVPAPPVLYWNNHDMARTVDRYPMFGDKNDYLAAMAMAMYLQRGIPIIYYGEELGQAGEVFDNLNDFEDIVSLNWIMQDPRMSLSPTEFLAHLNRVHKMTARGAMHWAPGEYHGFSQTRPWKIGVTTEGTADVVTESKMPHSLLHFYQQLLQLRQQKIFVQGAQYFMMVPKDVYAYRRQCGQQQIAVVANLSGDAHEVTLPSVAKEIWLQRGEAIIDGQKIKMAPVSCLAVALEDIK